MLTRFYTETKYYSRVDTLEIQTPAGLGKIQLGIS